MYVSLSDLKSYLQDYIVFISSFLKQNEMVSTTIVLLESEVTDPIGVNKEPSSFINVGTCFDFNTRQDNLFIVGTEDGKVFEYSKEYNNRLTTFDAHLMPIYAVKWNLFYKRIFITCSADWTVKIWDNRYRDPMFQFDLNAEVSDVAWAPYSSTTFAAVTVDGNIHFYDISLNIVNFYLKLITLID
jgi:dynein intermediate chain 1, axonemal